MLKKITYTLMMSLVMMIILTGCSEDGGEKLSYN